MKLHTQHWIVIGIGGWLIVSPWILGFYKINLATWNVIIAGIAIAFVALWDALSRTEAQQ